MNHHMPRQLNAVTLKKLLDCPLRPTRLVSTPRIFAGAVLSYLRESANDVTVLSVGPHALRSNKYIHTYMCVCGV